MQFWNNIIEHAMLGTGKKPLSTNDVEEAMVSVFETISADVTADNEDKFFHLASVAFNYRQTGSLPQHIKDVQEFPAPAELLSYCSTAAANNLKDILDTGSNGLLGFWLQQCFTKQQLVPPALIPILLNKAVQQKNLRHLVTACCGNCGIWLSQFNKDWNFSTTLSNEELWQTGNPEQRKQVLKQLRLSDAAKAMEWLQQTWPQENANTRADLLKVLSVGISDDDMAWLETIKTDKSQKVKEEALALLKQLPSSAIVQQYWQVLHQAINLKKEKTMLGLSSKMVLHIQLPEVVNEEIFKTGIDKLSNNKNFTDEELTIYQLIASVPPSLWQTHFNASPKNILQYFQKEEAHKKFITAFATATVQFKDNVWGEVIAQSEEVFYAAIITLLPKPQQELYCNKFCKQNEAAIIDYATKRTDEWGAELALNITRYAADNPYQYNRQFFNQHSHLLPASIIPQLQNYQPKEEYYRTTWTNTSEYIEKLLALKQQTQQAFS